MTMTDQASTLVALAQRQLDRVVSPSTRRETWDRTTDLAAQRPGLITFLALLAALSLPPLLLFTTFILSTLLLTLTAALVITLFWTGVALLLLVPSLFVAAGFAVFFWIWVVGSFVAARWLARRTRFYIGFGGSGSGSSGQHGQLAAINGQGQKPAASDRQFEGYKAEKEEVDRIGATAGL